MSDDTTGPVMARRPLVALLALITVVIVAVDQVTKYLAEARLEPGVRTPLVGDLLGLQLVYNSGAAFSLATGMTWIFTLVAFVVVVVILRVARRLRSRAWAIALGGLLGGSLGNLYDRLFRDPGIGRGHVVDFINYNQWFVGNVADIAIVVAAVLIGVLAIRGIEVDGSHVGRSSADAHVAETDDENEPDEALVEPVEEYSTRIEQPEDADADVSAWVDASGPASPVTEQPRAHRLFREESSPEPGASPEPSASPEPGVSPEPSASPGSRVPAGSVRATGDLAPSPADAAGRPRSATPASAVLPGEAPAKDPQPRRDLRRRRGASIGREPLRPATALSPAEAEIPPAARELRSPTTTTADEALEASPYDD